MSRLAQLVERKTLNLVVVGSSPTVGVSLLPFVFFTLFAGLWYQIGLFFCDGGTRSLGDKLLWRSWQRVGLIIPRSPVRSWSGAGQRLYSSVWQSMRLVSARSRVRSSLEAVRVGVVGNISACHADAPGSIPGHGVDFF